MTLSSKGLPVPVAKRCVRCCATKPVGQFGRRITSDDGHRPECKRCKAAEQRQYYAANGDRVKARMFDYREGRRDHIREYNARWYQQNSEEMKEYQRAYRQTERGKADGRRNVQRRRALLRGAHDDGHSWQTLSRHWEDHGMFGCVYCGGLFEDIDHVMPLSDGGAHVVENLVPSCRDCNRGPGGKCARDPREWLADLYPELAGVLSQPEGTYRLRRNGSWLRVS